MPAISLPTPPNLIPTEKHANTPIFLKATAGMRSLCFLLPHSKAQAILDQVRNVFRHSPFLYDPKFGVQIIPGEYEGVFGWLTVNYLAGVLGSKDEPSVGMVDMGGASCQITFETPHVPMENAFPINLNGTSRVVYTHLYLRFGRNEARYRYQAKHLLTGGATIQEDPCFVRGFRGVSPSGVEFVGSGDFMLCILQDRAPYFEGSFLPHLLVRS
ncbi:Ectonucleoside triphosphate diphosphohydrolase 6 [Massospora cicadina]|nr:Ectonucleoside triphosphate diphosphohydrolase 6 [Massospora cicadina]